MPTPTYDAHAYALAAAMGYPIAPPTGTTPDTPGTTTPTLPVGNQPAGMTATTTSGNPQNTAAKTAGYGSPTLPTFSGPASTPPPSYSYSGSGMRASDMAGSYLNYLASDPQVVVDMLTPYINQQTGRISIQDINNALHSVQDWTGSGRQASGMFNLEDLYFDAQGNPLMAQSQFSADYSGPEAVYSRTYTPVSSSTLQDLYTGDEGIQWWRPQEGDGTLESLIAGSGQLPSGVRGWSSLTPAEQQRLQNQGIFNLDDPRAQFILSDMSDPQYQQYFGNIDISGGDVGVADLQNLLRGGLSRQFDALGNTASPETEGWLANNPTAMLSLLGMVPGLQPFASLASGVMNVGQGIQNENWTQAALGGFGVYNTAANAANTGAASYNAGIDQPGSAWYEQQYGVGNTIPGQDFYANVTPGSLVAGATNNTLPTWANDALGAGGVAALTGGDPLYYAGGSLVNSGGQALLEYLGIDPSSPWYGIAQQGLNYMFNDMYNNWNQPGGGGGGSGSGGGGTGGGGGGGTTTPTNPTMPIPPGQQYIPPTFNYQQQPTSPYGQIPGGSGGSGYGSGPTYGTGETYGGDSAQDPGNPYNMSKPETVYG